MFGNPEWDPSSKGAFGAISMEWEPVIRRIAYNPGHADLEVITKKVALLAARGIHNIREANAILDTCLPNTIKGLMPPSPDYAASRMFIQDLLLLMSRYTSDDTVKYAIYHKIMKFEVDKLQS